jgi:branched-chain amino acid aminotransferase
MSHSFSRGSAIFEVLSVHETHKGPAVFRLDEHIKRLSRTARLLGMAFGVSGEEILNAVLQTVKRNNISKGYVKIVGFYPQIALDIKPPEGRLDLTVFAVDPAEDFKNLDFSVDRGITACISKWRKLDPQTVPIQAKASANYLNGMMVTLDAKERGFDAGIMLDTQGFIAEAPTDSVFLVKNGVLMTPSLGTVLESISRKSVLQVADREGIEYSEGRIPLETIHEADEIFLSCTPTKVLPIRQLDDRTLENTPGPMAKRLTALMTGILSGGDDRFNEWLFHVS